MFFRRANVIKFFYFNKFPARTMVDMYQKFPSIESDFNNKYMTALKQENKLGGDWVVTEKIHGANFCLITTNSSEIECSRRKDLLTEKEFFYDWKNIRDV